MATYKVLQDIEGEDKLIAWLTPKQTIYAAIVIVCCVLGFFLGRLNIFLVLPFLPPVLVFGFLAAPLGRDQPNDVWLAAQLRFFIKSRKRIWDQSGMQELVHITVPKKIERIYSDGLSQNEVKSRLRALSSTIDSRGWAVKTNTINFSGAPQFQQQFTNDDRLVQASELPQDVPIADVHEADDIMDAQNNMVAQRFDEEIKRQQQLHKQALMESLKAPKPTQSAPQNPDDFYFLKTPATAPAAPQLATFNPTVVAPGSSTTVQADDTTDAEAQALLEKIHKDKEIEKEALYAHEKVVKTPAEIAEEEQRLSMLRAEEVRKQQIIEQEKMAEERRRIAEERLRAQTAEREKIAQERLAKARATQSVPDAIIKELSRDSELKVSTIASQAKRSIDTNNDGEVVISLH